MTESYLHLSALLPSPPEAAVVAAMREFKEGVLARQHVQMQEMAKRWLTVERSLDADINLLAREMSEAREAGQSISPAKVYRLERYKHLQAQAQREIHDYAGWAGQTITYGQQAMVELGLRQSAQAIQMSYFPSVGAQFDRLPIEAVQHMVGICADGKPVAELLWRRMLPDQGVIGWRTLMDELIEGTARGRNPRETAARMRDALTGGLQKALVIARSEQMRVYRQASVDQYVESGVVIGQKRLAAHNGRVCPACLADDGTIYNLNQIIPDHPNGACTEVPVVEGMPEVTWTAGKDWFDQQPEAIQRSIMGDERLAAYKDGQIQWSQLGAHTFDPTWGGGLRVVPLTELLEGKRPKEVPIDLRKIELPGPAKTLHEMGDPYLFRALEEGEKGASTSYVTEWPDGTKAIFKPGTLAQEGIGALITDENNEVAAYRLAQLLGYDAVPETDYSRYKIGEKYLDGSVQRWVADTHTAHEITNERKGTDEAIAQRTRMAMFDCVIANTDRHNGNFLEDEKGKLWAIDHGISFRSRELALLPTQRTLEQVQAQGIFAERDEWFFRELQAGHAGWNKVPPAQIREMTETLAQWSQVPLADIDNIMHTCFKEGDAEQVYKRIQALKKEMDYAHVMFIP